MIKKLRLEDHIKIATIHAKRLQYGLKQIQSINTYTAEYFEKLDELSIAMIDSTILRFIKLQDTIGASIFPSILELTEPVTITDLTFIDKLNKLEKLGYLDNAQWWQNLRKLRNDLTHDYPNTYQLLAHYFQEFIIKTPELLAYWKELEKKVMLLIKK